MLTHFPQSESATALLIFLIMLYTLFSGLLFFWGPSGPSPLPPPPFFGVPLTLSARVLAKPSLTPHPPYRSRSPIIGPCPGARVPLEAVGAVGALGPLLPPGRRLKPKVKLKSTGLRDFLTTGGGGGQGPPPTEALAGLVRTGCWLPSCHLACVHL